ncbi:MAG: hypothetical protein ACI9YT_000540 [Halobacteriales archaeon]|jgi:hypothetical protein
MPPIGRHENRIGMVTDDPVVRAPIDNRSILEAGGHDG